MTNEKLKLNNENVEYWYQEVISNEQYENKEEAIYSLIEKFKLNVNPTEVFIKLAVIDFVNSTNLSRLVNNTYELAKKITKVKKIDERIRNGDPSVINEISKLNDKNIFSFASKYCYYHNCSYGKDDYSIFDSFVKEMLPKYFEDIKTSQIEDWRKNREYEKFNDFIKKKLIENEISVKDKRKKFDKFLWYPKKLIHNNKMKK